MTAADGRSGARSLVDLPRNASVESAFNLEAGSYRDRNGSVFYHDGEIFRGISARALANWERLIATRFFQDFQSRGSIVRTKRTSDPTAGKGGETWTAVLRHAPIPFVSYPYEWTHGMLKDAALLHLDLMLEALDEGFILKDSSAYNVQWHGAQPVFIDIPSFEVLEEGQPWVAYRQFCELFLYPLMLQAYKGIDFRPWLRGSLDGISAGSLRPLLSHRDLMRPGVMMHVVAQDALQRRYCGKEQNVRSALAQAGFDKTLIVRNVRNLRKIISRMTPGGSKTEWSDYAPSCATPPVSADGDASGILGATRAPSRASPPSMPTMWLRWTATGWLWSICIRSRRSDPTAARSCRWSSIFRIPRRARAGGARNGNPCRTAVGQTLRCASL
jgi:hypothetical protein